MNSCKCVDKSCKKITHVIYDLDGTLVSTIQIKKKKKIDCFLKIVLLQIDSEPIYFKAFALVLERFGYSFNDDLAAKILGRPEIAGCTILVEEHNLPITPEEFAKQFRDECNEYLPSVKLMPGTLKKFINGIFFKLIKLYRCLQNSEALIRSSCSFSNRHIVD